MEPVQVARMIKCEMVVIRMDGWLGFKLPRQDYNVVLELREVLDKMFHVVSLHDFTKTFHVLTR